MLIMRKLPFFDFSVGISWSSSGTLWFATSVCESLLRYKFRLAPFSRFHEKQILLWKAKLSGSLLCGSCCKLSFYWRSTWERDC